MAVGGVSGESSVCSDVRRFSESQLECELDSQRRERQTKPPRRRYAHRTATSRTAMKGEHLFANMRSAPFLQRVYLLGGEELVVLQATFGESSLGDSFQQITDFNDLPTSLFACNVDQSVFEDQEDKTVGRQWSHLPQGALRGPERLPV
ncbi:hypothetical protein E1301_Tti005628 [Triplophysa tibetana]|uniref:Uncharacterized protein n=1 Tax=Triplophysa tibetana TaxID=1572043 RepID=A0A5A9NH32_9TELE|nr:hypothetical protein E1301_Tti005628 [Triplophysa tibetana]